MSDIADELGLGYANMMATQGKLCAEKFSEVWSTFRRSDVPPETLCMMASQLSTWYVKCASFLCIYKKIDCFC
jgi:hypothetical protein